MSQSIIDKAPELKIQSRRSFLNEYRIFDKQFKTNKDGRYEYLVNFSQTKNKPIHRWFYYQEGYSPELVLNILDYLNLNNKELRIFDPFSGSGTTLLTAMQLGIKSSGFEINPFSAFMIKVKTRNYSNNDIKQIKEFDLPNYKPVTNVYGKYELKIIRNLFDKKKLEKIELLKEKIKKISNTKVRELLFANLVSILESVSNYKKGGNGLKRKKVNKDLDPFVEFKNRQEKIVEDLGLSQIKGIEPEIINDSCLNLEKHRVDNFDLSIFSPPYANCFDPFEVYKMELWVGEFVTSYDELREKRKSALTSHLNANLKKEFSEEYRTDIITKIVNYLSKQQLWDKRISKMIDTYFYEMYCLLNKLYKKTNDNGYCVIVVGNSSYGNLAVPTDILLAQLGEKAGFQVVEIIEARRNEASSQQHSKLGNFLEYIRESIIILKK